MAAAGARTGSIGASTEQLLDSAPDGVVIIDGGGTIRLVNRQAELLFGYDRLELLGRPVEILVPDAVEDVHPAHRARYFAEPTSRPMGAGLTLAARRKDGTEFPVDISLSSLQTDGGVLVLAAVRDITERLRLEAERSLSESRLHQAERDEERALLEAQLLQSQRLESVGQLAGGIAHDFNNLLAGIMNYAALVADGINDHVARHGLEDDDAVATMARDVEEITKVAKRAADLTHQLLIFSRREVVHPEVLDLNGIVADMEKLFRRTIGEDITLRTGLAPELPRLRADRGQIEQVLMNLVVNARDAMPGGGRLTIETAPFEVDGDDVRLHAVEPGPYVRLTVSDTGEGMTSDVQARAFEPFFTTRPKGSGSGLGLATVYGIVTQAGGDIVLYSEPGLGTTVRVHLPATLDADATDSRRTPDGDASLLGRGETVLLVEDEDIVRDPARRILARSGYRVLHAANADEAMSVVNGHDGPVDLLLTDVVMPGRSGKELAAAVAKASPGTRVLFMSGYSQDVIVHQGVLEAGIHLIEKPFAAEKLLRKVREVLDGDDAEAGSDGPGR